ncbi:helix-turn-helix domain-containing protein [Ligilactobacillus salivarius]|uniref:helix-turn-helix domain-containing protein n=1 Tax=Ligilactobacillus salivarius TaxID=1624 RepID=UPI003977CAEF
MTTFKKLKYDSNLKPRFSKGKAPSDDRDINYLHQRLDQLKKSMIYKSLKNELKSIADLAQSMQKTESEYLSYKQAMEILGLRNYRTLTAYIKAGLPVIEVANSKRIKRTDLDDFMTSHYVNNKEE